MLVSGLGLDLGANESHIAHCRQRIHGDWLPVTDTGRYIKDYTVYFSGYSSFGYAHRHRQTVVLRSSGGFSLLNPSVSNWGGGRITPPPGVDFICIYVEPRKIQWRVFMTFPEYGPATESAFYESIASTENPRWWSENDKNLNVTDHCRGNIVYVLHVT